MRFKVGERVRVKKDFECKYGITTEMRAMEGKIVTIESIDKQGDIMIKDLQYTWTEECFEKIEFEVGDKVRINEKVTIEDLATDHWRGCRSDTLTFLTYTTLTNVFTVKEVIDTGDVILKENDSYSVINKYLFELVKKSK